MREVQARACVGGNKNVSYYYATGRDSLNIEVLFSCLSSRALNVLLFMWLIITPHILPVRVTAASSPLRRILW